VKFLPSVFVVFLFTLPVLASDLPKNIKLEIKMEETLTSDSAQTGQKFSATLNKAVSAGNKVVFEKGAMVEGVVSMVEPTYNYRQTGELDLELVSIRANGKLYVLKTNTVLLRGKPTVTDPRTGRPMDPSSRKGDAARATIGSLPGMDRGGVSASIPGTDINVGTGGPASNSMQVIVPARSKLTFNVSSATTTDSTQ
ncbi:MAG TPA: hypothetical protein VLK33_07740, partial [Terriglobales bacterium]|nr:hypothetical protein [Terriglobales bacterium]